MSRVVKRYVFAMLAGIACVVAAAAAGVAIIERGASQSAGAIGGALIVGSFGVTAALVAREKGRSLWWALAAFVAPLLPIILLLPHTKQRRRALLGTPEVAGGESES